MVLAWRRVLAEASEDMITGTCKSEAVAAILTHLGLDTDDAGARPPPSQLDLI